jgi:uncharacterized protein YuzE
MKKEKFAFRVNIETRDDTGEVLAVYFQLRKGKTKVTKEYADGNVFADYDKDGKLLGIEMLAPCRASVLDKIAGQAPAKRFVRDVVPCGMLVNA